MGNVGAASGLSVRGRRQKLILIVPFGVARMIQPWGVSLLAQVVRSLRGRIEVAVWVMDDDEKLGEIFTRHDQLVQSLRPWIDRLTTRLGGHSVPSTLPENTLDAYYRAVVLSQGRELLRLIKDEFPIRGAVVTARREQELSEFTADVEAYITVRMASLLDGCELATVGLSLLDFMLLSTMYVARLLKSRHPEVPVVLGGEALDPSTAREICANSPWLDGAVVGYGEDALLAILDEREAGRPVRGLELPGFYSHRRSPPPGHEFATKEVVETFPHGLARWSDELRDQNWDRTSNHTKGGVHIFARRGCGWGHCTFCHQIFRKESYDAQLSDLCSKVAGILDQVPEARKRAAPIYIQFDNENNDPRWMNQFLDFLAGEVQRTSATFSVFFWLSAQQTTFDQALALLRERPGVRLRPSIGIETFNPHTLGLMKKGVDIQRLLLTLKMLQDSGGFNDCNYFMFYPLETIDSVKEELEILSSCLHLIAPSKARAYPLVYGAGPRDAIFADQEKFGVSVRAENLFWHSRILGIDLPIGYGSGYSFSLLPTGRDDFPIVSAYHDLLYNRYGEFLAFEYQLGNCGGWSSKASLLPRGAAIGVRTAGRVASLVYESARLRDFTYLRRLRAFAHLILTDRFPERREEAVFLVDGETLTRANFPGRSANNWQMTLTGLERQLLAYVYSPQLRTKVIGAFREKHGEQAVQGVLDALIYKRVIMERKGRLLGLPHDPAALREHLAVVARPGDGRDQEPIAQATMATSTP